MISLDFSMSDIVLPWLHFFLTFASDNYDSYILLGLLLRDCVDASLSLLAGALYEVMVLYGIFLVCVHWSPILDTTSGSDFFHYRGFF